MSDGSKNIVDTERYKYARTATEKDGKTIHSKDNGDPVAVALRGKNSQDMLAVLKENDMDDERYHGYFKTMGPGRFRMTAGQAIRYRWKRGDVTVIDGVKLPEPPPRPEKSGRGTRKAAAEAKKAEEAAAAEAPVEQVFDPST